MKKRTKIGVLLAMFSLTLTGCAAGEKGEKGDKGDPGQAGAQGPAGQDGVGILSITLTKSEGNVDYYQILYTDGSGYTFRVTNGQNGERGIQGEKGEDGKTPTVSIGANGNWIINDVDTGIAASGKDGKNGNTVLTGTEDPSNNTGVDGDSFINTTTFDFFVKENGAWVLKGNIKGAKGDQGEQGEQGSQGEKGTDGANGQNGSNGTSVIIGEGEPSSGAGVNGDSYIDIVTFDFYLKTDDVWSKVGNIKGNDAWNYNVYYTVTFEPNGGIMPDGFALTADVRAMDTIVLPEPTKVGYVFQGWFTGDTVNDGQFFNFTPVARNLTLYAKWQSGEFLVTFDYNDGATIPTTQTVLYGDDYSFAGPAREGYHFTGWTASYAHHINNEIPSSGVWLIAEDVTLVANWVALDYSITLDPKGGTVNSKTTETILVTFDEEYTLPEATRGGYTFLGWYRVGENDETLDALFPNEGTYKVASDLTLHAKWSEPVQYSITYMAPGANLPEGNPTTYTVNDSITLEKPTDEYGHDYQWYTNSSFTGSAITTFIGKNYLQDMTLWAKPIHTTSTTYTTIEGHRSQTSNCSLCGANEVVKPYQLSGTTLYFGSYPQSYVTDSSTKATLDAMVEIPSASNSKGWTDYHYYDNGHPTNGEMFYKDVVIGNEKYRGVYYTVKRPYESGTYNGSTPRITNSYATSTIHWFKYEPVQWTKLSSGTKGQLTFISKMSLDHQVYKAGGKTSVGGTDYVITNYMYSTIRNWLTNTFYSTCFNETEQGAILTTQVDNSKDVSSGNSIGVTVSSAYSDPTSDKVYLPSYVDMRNTSYGFVANNNASDTRVLYATDYSCCQGDENPSSSATSYWTRSPSSVNTAYVTHVYNDGRILTDNIPATYNRGLRPMLRVSIA